MYEAQIKNAARKLLALENEEPTDLNIAGVLENIAYSLRAEKENARSHGAPLNVLFRKCPQNDGEFAASQEIIRAQLEEDAVESDDEIYFKVIKTGERYTVGTVDHCGDLVIDFVTRLLPNDLGLNAEDFF